MNREHVSRQPDGSTFKVRTVGNEVNNFKLTEDGYAVARDSLGFFCYLDENGSLTNVRVRDREHRTGAEKEFLSTLNKNSVIQVLESRRDRREYQNFKSTVDFGQAASNVPAMRRMPAADANLNSGEKKALVILVQFEDTKFVDADPQTSFGQYLNQEGYNENNNMGSVRDYFKANSSGKFIPNFDVVGPITLPGSAFKTYGSYSKYGNEGARVALSIALDSLIARGTVDFKQYDNDGDQILDFVHMIYAGIGSNDTDQDSAMWPHMWDMRSPGEVTSASLKTVASSGRGFLKKSYYVGPYACSNELDGVSWMAGKNIRVGVGPFIHEFGHLLGLGDLYATNGESIYTLGNWDVMDGGAYNCPYQEYPISCAPPYYSAFERMYLGWLNADEVSSGNGIQLAPVSENTALKVSNPKNSDEFYLLEYRDRKGWDVGLPNHGMLIWHIDYDDTAWFYSEINTSSRMRVDIVEADGMATQKTITGDVFPGTSHSNKYTSFDKFVTWAGADLGVSLTKITEAGDYSYVSFDVNGGAEISSSSEIVASSSSEMNISSSSVVEISSSSVEVIASSSSVVPESSSSAVVVAESSSSEILPESSSSEDKEPVEESSSSIEIASSDDSEIPGIVRQSIVKALNVSRSGGALHVSGLPQGSKSLRVFTLNGNLLMSRPVEGSSFSLDAERLFGKSPVIIQVVNDRRVIATIPLR